MNFKHSGDIGDLIYSLPVIKSKGESNLFLQLNGLGSRKYDGTRTGFDQNLINFITPLLLNQPYLKTVETYKKQLIDINLDLFRRNVRRRNVRRSNENISQFVCRVFNVPFINESWLTVEPTKIAKVVVNRTTRYNNHQAISVIKNLIKEAVFVGLPNEYKHFCKTVCEIPYYEVRDLWKLACVIKGAEVFIGNQSCCMAMAIGMGQNVIQEVYEHTPDCIFDQPNINYIRTNRSINILFDNCDPVEKAVKLNLIAKTYKKLYPAHKLYVRSKTPEVFEVELANNYLIYNRVFDFKDDPDNFKHLCAKVKIPIPPITMPF